MIILCKSLFKYFTIIIGLLLLLNAISMLFIANINFGLDESRENQKTISEVSRILKNNGRFVNVSRENSFMRQYNILEPFGFLKEEAIELCKRARIYADTDNLVSVCKDNNLMIEKKLLEGKFCVTTFLKKA